MSYPYRIRVKQQMEETVDVDDRLVTKVRLTPLRPGAEMHEILVECLEDHGWTPIDGEPGRYAKPGPGGEDRVFDVNEMTVTTSVAMADAIHKEGELEVIADSDDSDSVKQAIKAKAEQDLAGRIAITEEDRARKRAELAAKVADKLQAGERERKRDLNIVLSDVYAEATKRNARDTGTVKSIEEGGRGDDYELTIKIAENPGPRRNAGRNTRSLVRDLRESARELRADIAARAARPEAREWRCGECDEWHGTDPYLGCPARYRRNSGSSCAGCGCPLAPPVTLCSRCEVKEWRCGTCDAEVAPGARVCEACEYDDRQASTRSNPRRNTRRPTRRNVQVTPESRRLAMDDDRAEDRPRSWSGQRADYVSPRGGHGKVGHSELAMHTRIAGRDVERYALWYAEDGRVRWAQVEVDGKVVDGLPSEVLPDEVRREVGWAKTNPSYDYDGSGPRIDRFDSRRRWKS